MNAETPKGSIRRSSQLTSKLLVLLAGAVLVGGLTGCSALSHILPSAVRTLTPTQLTALVDKCDTAAYAMAVKKLAADDSTLVSKMTAAQERKLVYPLVQRGCAKGIAKKFPHGVIPISNQNG
jgi:hypothetical protein